MEQDDQEEVIHQVIICGNSNTGWWLPEMKKISSPDLDYGNGSKTRMV
jgi:hypothetical protein